jgi:uncharacterized damage-inducible protein DinB
MYDKQLTIEQNLALLADAPSRIAELTASLSAKQLVTPPQPGEWSVRDILGHLRACSDMWGKYIGLILAEERPTFKAVNPTTWIKSTDYLELEFETSFAAYKAQREELVTGLETLPAEAWERTATVTGAGKPRERTLRSYAMWLANHEQTHLRQIGRIVKGLI